MDGKILNGLSEIVSELTQTAQSINMDTDFVNDCNLSSFQMAMFFCEVESRYGIIIDDFVKYRCASLLVEMIVEKVGDENG